MSKPDSWFPLYVADYLADTTRLTTEQHGAYLLIIMDYWRNGPPPDDDGVLARITGLTIQRWKAHRKAIQVFFSIREGVWRQKRIDEELDRAKSMVAQRAEAGRASAKKRWGNGDGNGEANEPGNEGGNGPVTGTVTNAARKNAPSHSPSPSPTHPPSPAPAPAPAPDQSAEVEPSGSVSPTTSTGVAPPKKQAARPAKDPEAKTAKVAEAYTAAYLERYGVKPLLDAKPRSQLSQFIDRVGKDDAPAIAAFYVRHNKAFYVSRQHPVGLLLSDADGLRTQWLNGRTVTETQARQADRKQSNLTVAQTLIAEARNAGK